MGDESCGDMPRPGSAISVASKCTILFYTIIIFLLIPREVQCASAAYLILGMDSISLLLLFRFYSSFFSKTFFAFC